MEVNYFNQQNEDTAVYETLLNTVFNDIKAEKINADYLCR